MLLAKILVAWQFAWTIEDVDILMWHVIFIVSVTI